MSSANFSQVVFSSWRFVAALVGLSFFAFAVLNVTYVSAQIAPIAPIAPNTPNIPDPRNVPNIPDQPNLPAPVTPVGDNLVIPEAPDLNNPTYDFICDVYQEVELDDLPLSQLPEECGGDNGGGGGGGDENAPPVITLNGDSTITITEGDSFDDPGAMAADAEDGDLTDDIVVGGDTVDSDTPGTYIITYSVTDSDGATTVVNRTVIVEEENDDGGGSPPPPPPPPSGGGGGGTTTSPGGGGGGGGGGNTTSSPGFGLARDGALFAETGICPALIESFIKLGEANDFADVLKLQQFLREEEGFENVSVTGFYDEVSRDAVNAFQLRYAGDVLTPWGIGGPTGFVYYTTSKKINELHCDNVREFALSQFQLDEINSFRSGVEGGGQPGVGGLPAAGEVGAAPTGPILAGEDEESEEGGEGGEGESQLAGAAAAGNGATQSSLGRLLGGIGSIFTSVLDLVF